MHAVIVILAIIGFIAILPYLLVAVIGILAMAFTIVSGIIDNLRK